MKEFIQEAEQRAMSHSARPRASNIRQNMSSNKFIKSARTVRECHMPKPENPVNPKTGMLEKKCNRRIIKKVRLDSMSGLRGAMSDGKGKYISRIYINGKYIYLGHFNTAEEASVAYHRELIKYTGGKRWDSKNKYSGYVYVIKWEQYYKIGVAKDPNGRIDNFRSFMPTEIAVVCVMGTDEPYHVEGVLHNRFQSKRAKGEWFILSDEDVNIIIAIGEAIKKNPRMLI